MFKSIGFFTVCLIALLTTQQAQAGNCLAVAAVGHNQVQVFAQPAIVSPLAVQQPVVFQNAFAQPFVVQQANFGLVANRFAVQNVRVVNRRGLFGRRVQVQRVRNVGVNAFGVRGFCR